MEYAWIWDSWAIVLPYESLALCGHNWLLELFYHDCIVLTDPFSHCLGPVWVRQTQVGGESETCKRRDWFVQVWRHAGRETNLLKESAASARCGWNCRNAAVSCPLLQYHVLQTAYITWKWWSMCKLNMFAGYCSCNECCMISLFHCCILRDCS